MRISAFMKANEGAEIVPALRKAICSGVRRNAKQVFAGMNVSDDMIIEDILSCDIDEAHPGETHVYEWSGWMIVDIYMNADARLPLAALRLDESAVGLPKIPPSRREKLRVN